MVGYDEQAEGKTSVDEMINLRLKQKVKVKVKVLVFFLMRCRFTIGTADLTKMI